MATSAILGLAAYEFPRNLSIKSPQTTAQIVSAAAAAAPPPPPASSLSRPNAMTQNSSPRRPKLTLNTNSPSITTSYGRGTTALRLDTSSPTSRNTYKNAYHPQPLSAQPGTPLTPTSPTLPQAPTSLPRGTAVVAQSSSTYADVPRSSSRRSREPSPRPPPPATAAIVPYIPSSDIRSILSNGPHPKRGRPPPTPMSSETFPEPTSCASPSLKKVCFREPLTEDIFTTRYTARHSDLRSRSTSPALPLGSGLHMTPMTQPSAAKFPTPRLREVAPPPQARSADAADEAVQVAQAEISAPKTPVAGRAKKQREWTWTLGPLPGAAASSSRKDDSSDSEEDLAASLGESVAAAGSSHLR